MTERTPKALADAIEPRLREKLAESRRGKFKISMSCASKEEAVLLANELLERGWLAKIAAGLVLVESEFEVADLVLVTGRSKRVAS